MDQELRKRDQYFDEVIRQRDLEWREELERRETKWREVIRDRDVAFWDETGIHESNLLKMLEDRVKVIKAALESRDRDFFSNLEHCKQSLRLRGQHWNP